MMPAGPRDVARRPEPESGETVASSATQRITYQAVELGGVRYAILPAAALHELCRRAGAEAVARNDPVSATGGSDAAEFDARDLARRLAARRGLAGLTQAGLAHLAGVRVETLNRIERGHTTPDFATIRKLVVAMNEYEARAGRSGRQKK